MAGEDLTHLEVKPRHDETFLKRGHEEAFMPNLAPIQHQPPKKPKASRRKKKRDPNEPQV